jgi:hypothetical protein
MTDPARALDHIYACSGAETAATSLAQAPGWGSGPGLPGP